jgi:hypothetical protein
LQLLSVFSNKRNLNLVLEFLATDLEYVIRDKALVFMPADVKSWMAMTVRGLDFIHRNGVLHRVGFLDSRPTFEPPLIPLSHRLAGPEAE